MRICRYPVDARHIVIQKTPEAWCVSMQNWGLRCGWFDDEKSARASVKDLNADYNAYYSFWRRLSKRNPGYVQIIKYEDLVENNNLILEKPAKLNIASNLKAVDLNFTDVPMSPITREVRITNGDSGL
jgi:hypothetical protein